MIANSFSNIAGEEYANHLAELHGCAICIRIFLGQKEEDAIIHRYLLGIAARAGVRHPHHRRPALPTAVFPAPLNPKQQTSEVQAVTTNRGHSCYLGGIKKLCMTC